MTLEELRKLDHDICVYFKKELCRVAVVGCRRYLLSNNSEYNGSSPDIKHGYRYGWWLCNDYDADDQRLYRNLKPAKRRPL